MSKFSVKKPLTVLVAVVMILVLGVVSYTRMTPDLLPNIDLPYVIVMTPYPGASPEEVEAEISKPLEQAMATLDNIDTVSSTSSENYSLVILQFTEDVNMDTVTVDILQKINTISGGWDDMVSTPTILKLNPNMLPVMIAAVGYGDMDVYELSDFVDTNILPKLEGTTGVASVSASGVLQQEIRIELSQTKIDVVNTRIAREVNAKLDEAEEELRDGRNEVRGQQGSLQSGKEELEKGKDVLIDGAGGAGAQLNEERAKLEGYRQQIEDGITQAEDARAELVLMKEVLGAYKLVDSSIVLYGSYLSLPFMSLADVSDAMDRREALQIKQNGGMTDAAEDAELAALTNDLNVLEAAIYEDTGYRLEYLHDLHAAYVEIMKPFAAMNPPITTIDGVIAFADNSIVEIDKKIAEAKASLAGLEAGTKTLDELEAELEKQKLGGVLGIAEGSAQILVGEMTLSQILGQLDTGLEQLEDARTTALKNADVNGIINIQMVSTILNAQDFSMPAGYVSDGSTSYLVTVGDNITSLEQLEDLVLFDMGIEGVEPVRLSDVADVYFTDNSGDIYANINGSAGILFTFNKQSNYSTAGVSDNLTATFAALEEQYPGLSFTPLMDQGDYIYIIVRSVIENLLFGALLAVIVLFLFLRDIRPTFITLCSIPISVVFAFVLMYFSGITLNMLSLSGLAVAVGMLVDNSVVVIENIYRLRAKGYSAVQAAVSGAGQVAGAIAASTLTTVCIFLPIVFVEGLTRQLFTDFALTFGYALIASLIIALTLVPAMSSRMLTTVKPNKNTLMNPFLNGYERALKWVLGHKVPVLAGTLVLLVLSGLLTLSRGFSFMPNMDMGQLTVSVTMPEDASFAEATRTADEVVDAIGSVEGVDTVGAMMGSSGISLMGLGGGGGDDTSVTMYVLLDEGSRRSSEDIGDDILAQTEALDCEVSVSSSSGMDISMLAGEGVSVRIYGENLDDMRDTARGIAALLGEVEGVGEVNDGIGETGPEIRFVVDKDKAMEYGLTVAQVYMEVSSALTTEVSATSLTYDGKSYTVIIEKADVEELTPAFIKSYKITVTNADGEEEEIFLSEIATIVDTETLASIARSEGNRYIDVSATIAEGYNVTLVSGDIESALAGYELPAGMRYELAGESETIMESMSELMNMLLLGIVLVYLIMVAQFQSLKSPFIVMFTIPLAFTGGLLALFLTGFEISVISLIGFVMLVGIIVNNGIVLVDYINQLRAEGTDTREAIIEAGITRMRPILMTTITTVFGLLTMAFGMGSGAAMMQPIAIVCIGGLVYATALTLFVIPAMYEILNRKKMVTIDDAELEIVED